MLKDSFGRVHDYLRISLTDVCNFRCAYCMPDEAISFMPAAQLMQANEIDKIAEIFVKMGVKKIRLTGGEPLVRKDVAEIIHLLSKYPVELTLTTNGSRVDDFIEVFEKAGIKSVNVSLDTLDKEKFSLITRRNVFDKVIGNINLLINLGFHVKVNAVVMRGINDNEILDFIAWTKELPIHVRFIEFMPFAGNQWDNEKVFSYQEILDVVAAQYSYVRLKDDKNGTAKKFKLLNHAGSFAVISTMSAPFCENCNRMRLTADGKMKNCLFSKGETDILSAYRNNEDITPLVEQCVIEKKEALGGQFTTDKIDATTIENRSMISIGG
jgi:cyclic pyranopterin phosphate synthase